jgi:hypothetical protein
MVVEDRRLAALAVRCSFRGTRAYVTEAGKFH